jgi:hypothetical protein
MSWAVCKDFDIITRVIDDETLVYYHGSGDTHRLSSEAGLLLKLLMNSKAPLATEQLIDQNEQAGSSKYNLQSIENILQTLSVLKFVKKVY